MSIAIPSADVLITAVADYLERELAPTLTGYHRFQARIAVNVLKTVAREWRLDATQPGTEGDAAHVLAEQLRDGSLALDTPGLADTLRDVLRRQLAVDNPTWIGPVTPASPATPQPR